MNFKMIHNNINVFDLQKSLEFYKQALALSETRRIEADDFTIVFLGDGISQHRLELTWMKDRKEPYNLGDNEFHLAFETEEYEAARSLHQQMGCICFENQNMGIYFITDPDGYWLEILPAKY